MKVHTQAILIFIKSQTFFLPVMPSDRQRIERLSSFKAHYRFLLKRQSQTFTAN